MLGRATNAPKMRKFAENGADIILPVTSMKANPDLIFGTGRLILGGHSFIAPLGSDPAPTESEQLSIVTSCLSHGIHAIDTTYAPERIAVGRVLSQLAPTLRARAKPIIWNFFGGTDPALPGPSEWTAAGFDEAMSQLACGIAPMMVVHSLADCDANSRQIELAASLKQANQITAIGLWGFDIDSDDVTCADFVVSPYNPEASRKSCLLFAKARQRGLAVVGTSPFGRGWLIDRLCSDSQTHARGESRESCAELLLRYAAMSSEVDRMIVAMRRSTYVQTNLNSLDLGPLTQVDMDWLEASVA